jgi:antirestriction protein
LPKCSGRNDDPIGKRAKAAKAAEAKATKEAKAADKQRRAAEAESAKERLAEMEIEESFVQAQEDKQRIVNGPISKP